MKHFLLAFILFTFSRSLFAMHDHNTFIDKQTGLEFRFVGKFGHRLGSKSPAYQICRSQVLG